MTTEAHPSGGAVSVLVVDDHPLFRGALVDALSSREGIQLAGEAEDGEQALDRIRELRPDVALVDLRLPRLGGMDVLRQVVREGLRTRVVVITAEADAATREAVERAGAAGCLAKSADAPDIADAVVAARNGKAVLGAHAEPLAPVAREELDPSQRLTPRELEVLRLVAEGYSAPGIAKELYLSSTTVSTHLKHIYRKLEVPDRAAAVAKALRAGLLH